MNEKVFVPIMSSGWDDDALAVYQEALPGYEVIGFTGTWESTDALHCRIKGIPDLDMLQIFHNPVNDNPDNINNGYEVQAIIDDLSETGLVESGLKVNWWTDEMAEYESISLNVCAQDIPDCYDAVIPEQLNDIEVKYYIEAADNSGRMETLPMAGYYSFETTASFVIVGDANNDGEVNVLDVVVVVNHILGQDILDDEQVSLVDLNEDGKSRCIRYCVASAHNTAGR